MAGIGSDDHARMVEFELRWYTLGGGPEAEIREQFGVGSAEFFSELATALQENPPRGVSMTVIEDMKRVARRRCWLAA